jgi:hypothetical protein
VRMTSTASVPTLARSLLCMLRDLDLRSGRVAVTRGRTVRVDGCLSLGWPSLSPLCYRLRMADGAERVLRIELLEDALRLCISDRTGQEQGAPVTVKLEMSPDKGGWLTAREIGARIAASGAGAREAEHFMRRVVRGAWRSVAA